MKISLGCAPLILWLSLFSSTPSANGARILFLHPMATHSETNLFLPFAEALAARGHELTVVTPVKSSSAGATKIRQIVPTTPLLATDFMKRPVLEERANYLAKHKSAYLLEFDAQFILDRCHEVLRHPEFVALYRAAKPGAFDLIVMSGFFQNCLEGLLYRTQAPFIMITSMPCPHWITSIGTGFHPPPSFIPIPLVENEDEMGFWDRLGNTVTVWFFTFLSYYAINPEMDAIGRQYTEADIPASVDIERNVSMIFTNAHFSLTYPRPMLPDMIEIGGLHCHPPKKLPAELDSFIAGAKDGLILFSLGSVVQAHELPPETTAVFMRVFSRLPQCVLWKFETEKMDGLPKNVKLSKWLPQQDILGHPNTKLFISHGGLLSTMESAYHGVPVLGIPIFVDQMINMRNIRKLGYSETVEILELTEVDLERAIRNMLTDTKYAARAKEISTQFRDQPQSPMERAIYWTEYVIRHKGAHHLRSGARKLNFWQYHSVDVIGVLLAGSSGFVALLWLCLRWCWRRIFIRQPLPVPRLKKLQ